MAKFLLHTFYDTSHVLPMQAVAKALMDRGHEVVWLTSPAQEARVRVTGARFVATSEIDCADEVLKEAMANPPSTLEGSWMFSLAGGAKRRWWTCVRCWKAVSGRMCW
jgi:UDP:flavonoid glycosyltransferase YjiC (YdhE family)